jgi:hypothetical protein
VKGKKGPYPPSRKERRCDIHGDTIPDDGVSLCPQCEQELSERNQADNPELVEQVVDELTAEKPNGHTTLPETVYQCDDCAFLTPYLPEMNEHHSGTGHIGYESVESKAEQPDLFVEPGPIVRCLKVKISDEELSELWQQAASITMALVEQEEAAVMAKDRVKRLTEDRNRLVAKLRDPYKLADVACVWTVNVEENSKTLLRIDTNELVETRALSAEDRQTELAKTEAANQSAKVGA